MRNDHAPATHLRICAWCGERLSATADASDGREHDGSHLDGVARTHTICDACLVMFFADEHGADLPEDALQPVTAQRRR